MEASSALLPGSPEVLGLAGSAPLGVIITPLAPLPTAEPLRRDVLRCAACAGVICEHCRLDGSAWICALCGHCNEHTAHSDPLQRRPELSADAVEYAPLDTQPGNASSGAVRISIPDAPVPSITALLVDESASGAQLTAVRRALTDALPELSRPDSHLALISYGAAVSVYRLGEPTEPAVPSAVVVPADAPDGASIGVLRAGAAQHVAPAQLGAAAALAALEALAPPPDADDAASPGRPSAHGIVGALEVALQLIHLASAPPPSRLRATLVVISAGEWTGGDALADLGSRLCARHATVHVAADSLHPLGMRAMRRLLLPCNGSALLTRGAHVDAAEAERIECHVAETLVRSAGRAYAAEIEIRTSRNLEVDQIVGPVSARAARRGCKRLGRRRQRREGHRRARADLCDRRARCDDGHLRAADAARALARRARLRAGGRHVHDGHRRAPTARAHNLPARGGRRAVARPRARPAADRAAVGAPAGAPLR